MRLQLRPCHDDTVTTELPRNHAPAPFILSLRMVVPSDKPYAMHQFLIKCLFGMRPEYCNIGREVVDNRFFVRKENL